LRLWETSQLKRPTEELRTAICLAPSTLRGREKEEEQYPDIPIILQICETPHLIFLLILSLCAASELSHPPLILHIKKKLLLKEKKPSENPLK
jgi:hypothetical protein